MLRVPLRPPERSMGVGARAAAVWGRLVRSTPLRRRTLIGAGAGLALLIVGLLAFGPIVRARIESEADRRRLDVTIGSVRPGFFAVVLGDVQVKPKSVPGLAARFDRVRVVLGASMSLREIQVRGGALQIDGEPEDVIARVRELRGAKGDGAPADPHRRRVAFDLDGIALAWKLPSGGEIAATDLRFARDEGVTKLGCGHCTARYHHASVEVEGGDGELEPDGAMRRLTAKAMRVSYAPPRAAKEAAAVAAPASAEPAPPPLPPAAAKRSKAALVATALSAGAEASEPVLPLPDLAALRARIATLTTTLGQRVPDGSSVEVAGLSASLEIGGDPVTFGPGAFTLARHGDGVHVTFASEGKVTTAEPGGTSTPLSIDAELPIGRGDVTARLSGGPVSLALLGVKENTKGLFDVGRGTVSGKGQLVLAAAGDALTFDGQVALRSISVKNRRLSLEPVRDLQLDVSGRGVLDEAGRLRIDDAEVAMKALHVRAHGMLEQTDDHFGATLSLDVLPAACQSLVESAPAGLLPTVRMTRMDGTFGANVRVELDTRSIDKLVLDYQVDDRCRVTEVPRELSRERFEDVFTYRTYHPDGSQGETTTGPGSPNWTKLDEISPYMIIAVLTTEDGGFYGHHGFNHYAIRQSVQANLKARRFVRGASTITMQLAKNLFLSRDKTLSRKIEEVVLTDYLEQIFRKDDMMELYLNVVEFGPDVYGITQAADYYFGRRPEELNVAECYFLATLLPAPVRYGKLREKGEASERWMNHIHALLGIAEQRGKLTQAEVNEGLSQKVVFVRDGEPRPEPRRPFTNVRREPSGDPYGDDGTGGWQPLE